LYLSTGEVAQPTDGLASADPPLQKLAENPSLRGRLNALSLGSMGVQYARSSSTTCLADVYGGRYRQRGVSLPSYQPFRGRSSPSEDPSSRGNCGRFIEIELVLDFTALEPGRVVTNAITQIAQNRDLTGSYQARIRLTGLVPINDDGFATLKHHWVLSVALTV
jgi:hypothetical protein